MFDVRGRCHNVGFMSGNLPSAYVHVNGPGKKSLLRGAGDCASR